MALNANFSNTFGDAVSVYYMISGVTLNRLANAATVSLAIFKDAASREAYKAAQTQIADLVSQIQAKRIAMATAQDQATATQLDLDARALQVQLETAQTTMRSIKAVDDPTPVQIGPSKIATVLDANGNVAISAGYTYLKTLPRFAGATDA